MKVTWMSHAAHFICGHQCRFHLSSHVSGPSRSHPGYIVSTVGEYAPSTVFERGELRARRDDDPFETMGASPHLYESMVFKAKKVTRRRCCPYKATGSVLYSMRYMTADEATEAHMKLLKKWGTKR